MEMKEAIEKIVGKTQDLIARGLDFECPACRRNRRSTQAGAVSVYIKKDLVNTHAGPKVRLFGYIVCRPCLTKHNGSLEGIAHIVEEYFKDKGLEEGGYYPFPLPPDWN